MLQTLTRFVYIKSKRFKKTDHYLFFLARFCISKYQVIHCFVTEVKSSKITKSLLILSVSEVIFSWLYAPVVIL